MPTNIRGTRFDANLMESCVCKVRCIAISNFNHTGQYHYMNPRQRRMLCGGIDRFNAVVIALKTPIRNLHLRLPNFRRPPLFPPLGTRNDPLLPYINTVQLLKVLLLHLLLLLLLLLLLSSVNFVWPQASHFAVFSTRFSASSTIFFAS